jgi:hypothetical protein
MLVPLSSEDLPLDVYPFEQTDKHRHQDVQAVVRAVV